MREGRQLEELVASIKQMLHADAVVRSPEYVTDIDTGQKREVDIAVRVPAGASEIFIAVECRDRGSTQDVTWIEQLITKKHSIGADLMIAVTSSSFTEPAILKAARHGVLVRQLGGSLAEEIADWANEAYVELKALKVAIKFLHLETDAGPLFVDRAARFYEERLQKELTADELLSMSLEPMFKQFGDMLPDHGSGQDIRFSGPPETLRVVTPISATVQRVRFEGSVERHVEKLPLASGFSYADAASAKALVKGYRFGNAQGGACELLLSIDKEEGLFIVDLTHLPCWWWDETLLKCAHEITLTGFEWRFPEYKPFAA